MRFRNSLGISFAVGILTGCTHFAARPNACEDLNNQSFPPGGAVVLGNVFQVGDCSLSRYFYIDTGGYYSDNKVDIDYYIKEIGSIKTGTPQKISILSRHFNCRENADRAFYEKLAQNKNEIFGEDFSNSASKVNRSIQRVIDSDFELKNGCN